MHVVTGSAEMYELICLDASHAEHIRRSLPRLEQLEISAGIARGFGDLTRLRIAAALAAGDELCVCDLAWVVGARQPLVSQHLRMLKDSGVAGSRRVGRKMMYQLTERGRAVLSVVLDVAPANMADRPEGEVNSG